MTSGFVPGRTVYMNRILSLSRCCAALSLLPLLLLSLQQDPFTRDDSAIERMRSAFEKRSISCAPKAPMETEFGFVSDPSPHQPVRLVFRAMAMEAGGDAEIYFEIPPEMTLHGGQTTMRGTLEKGRAYEFAVTVSIERPGQFEVRASAVAGVPEARFGRRESLYIDYDGASIKVSKTGPKADHESPPVPMGTQLNETITDVERPAEWGPVPITPRSQIKTDPNGEPLQEEGGGVGIQAPVTVTGYFRYRHNDGTLHGAYGTQAFLWDDDTLSPDDLMAQVVCDSNGFYSATFDNNDPEGGTTDLYVEWRTYNGAISVHDNSGSGGWYTGAGSIVANIPNGNFDYGSWYYDTGTPGVADGIERAYQVCDIGSAGWAHGNYTLGFTPHYTYFQWYDNSTDGTYYTRSQDRVFLQEPDFMSPDVVIHEFGHSFHDSVYGETDWPPGAGGSHWFTNHYTPGLAITEGYATYYSCSAQGDEQWYDDNNPGNLIHFDCDANWDGNGAANGNADNLSNNPNWGYDTESAVLAFLLDLDDARNSATDPYDWTTLGDNEIQDVLRFYTTGGHHCHSIQEFFNGWYSRGWAYRPQINAQMHVHGMNQGITRPTIGLYSGVSLYGGTWYYGGYGRGSFDIKNYSSIAYNLNQCYVWLRGPGGQDVGQFGGDGNGTPLAAGATRNVWLTADQTGYNSGAPNFVYGLYTVTAGHYRSDNAWQLLDPAEPGTNQQVSVNVIRDTDPPDFCAANDDGDCVNSQTSLRVYGSAFDADSSIQGYWTRVGTAPGLGNAQDWVFHAANNQNNYDYTLTGMSLAANTLYYITVVARNIEGLDTWAYTDGIIAWDATAPGPVTVTDDGVAQTDQTQIHFVATSSEGDGCISGYWTRVGTAPYLGDEQDWVFHATGDIDLFDHTITGLTMNAGATYYVTVVARNMSGLDTWGVSNGIYIGKAITGRVRLEDYEGDYTSPLVNFQIRNVGSSIVLQSHNVQLDSAGNYVLLTTIASGNYDLYCKPTHWLRRKRGNIVIGSSGATGQSFSVINGDCDGDNEVAIGDYALLSSAFGSSPGDGNWNVNADLNGDLTVDIGDYAILSARFSQTGEG